MNDAGKENADPKDARCWWEKDGEEVTWSPKHRCFFKGLHTQETIDALTPMQSRLLFHSELVGIYLGNGKVKR